MIGDALIQASVGEAPARPGNGDLAMSPHGVYATSKPDRWLTLAVRNDSEWHCVLELLGRECNDQRFSTAKGRVQYSEDIDLLMTQWLANCDGDNIAKRLQQVGVCAHISWNMQDIASDPHLLARKALVEVSAVDIPPRLAVGAPAQFSRTNEVGIRRLTPALGQDEDYVFGELLRLSSTQRADFQAREVIL